MNNAILGIWEIDPEDVKSLEFYGRISMEFKNNGELIYNVYLKDKIQSVLLKYNIKGDLLITNQLSAPQIEETQYQILSDGKLQLNFNNIKSTFVKIKSYY